MTATIGSGPLLSLDGAARVAGELTGDKPPCRMSLWNWIVKGRRSIFGGRVVLRATQVGPVWVTTGEAVAEFLRAIGKLKAEKAEEVAA